MWSKSINGKLLVAASCAVLLVVSLLGFEVYRLHETLSHVEEKLSARISGIVGVFEFELKDQSNVIGDKITNLEQRVTILQSKVQAVNQTVIINAEEARDLLERLGAARKELDVGVSAVREVGDQLIELRTQLRTHAEQNRDAEYSLRQHVKKLVVKLHDLESAQHTSTSVPRSPAPSLSPTPTMKQRQKPIVAEIEPNTTHAMEEEKHETAPTCPTSCSGRGLVGRNLRRLMHGSRCACVCVEGFSGAHCEVAGNISRPPDSAVPKISIPDAPQHVAQLSKDAACKLASVEYYEQKKDTSEFRSDTSLRFFWSLYQKSGFVHRPCDQNMSQQRGVGGFGKKLIVLDVGAGVGSNARVWESVFFNQSECLLNVTVLLVEANPVNALIARAAVERLASNRVPDSRITSDSGFVVRNVAAAHYDGEGIMFVDDRQARDKPHKGNERGRLLLNASDVPLTAPDDNEASAATLQVPVRTIRSLIGDLFPPHTDAPVDELYIPIMKIDVEGLEPAVLFAMGSDLLARTGAIVFECHKLWLQAELGERHGSMAGNNSTATPVVQTLENVVDFLASHGFVSYKIGQRYWIPLTEPYWDGKYETDQGWGNCFAVRAGSPEYDTLFSMHPKCPRLSSGIREES